VTRHSLALVLAATLSAAGCGGEAEAASEPGVGPADRTPPAAHATRVEVAEVRPSTARLEMSLPGEVEGSREAMLAAALGGFVERVLVSSGDTVEEGQVLARIDSATHQANLQLVSAERAVAETELARAERLRGSIADAQIDASMARAGLARMREQQARIQANRAVIRAPFAGTVAAVDIEEGEVAVPGAPVIRLVQLSPAKVSLSVPDRDVVALEVGMPVRVRTAARPTPLEGRIARVHPAADLDTRAFTVDVEVDNAGLRLLPGMIANVELSEPVEADVVVLPQHVIVTQVGANGVFVLEGEGVARWRPVELGRVIREQVVVTSGLSVGEAVLVTGHRELVDGDPVMVVRRGACCTSGRVVFEAGE